MNLFICMQGRGVRYDPSTGDACVDRRLYNLLGKLRDPWLFHRVILKLVFPCAARHNVANGRNEQC